VWHVGDWCAFALLMRAGAIGQATIKRNEYWSTATPYHYLRFEDHPKEGMVLVVGGGDHQVRSSSVLLLWCFLVCFFLVYLPSRNSLVYLPSRNCRTCSNHIRRDIAYSTCLSKKTTTISILVLTHNIVLKCICEGPFSFLVNVVYHFATTSSITFRLLLIIF
jgi:hypothetical protein